jgi:hypothetical protein
VMGMAVYFGYGRRGAARVRAERERETAPLAA